MFGSKLDFNCCAIIGMVFANTITLYQCLLVKPPYYYTLLTWKKGPYLFNFIYQPSEVYMFPRGNTTISSYSIPYTYNKSFIENKENKPPSGNQRPDSQSCTIQLMRQIKTLTSAKLHTYHHTMI